MRRIDIINSVLKLTKTIDETGIYIAFREAIAPDEKANTEKLLEVMQSFLARFSTFNETDKKVLEIFDLAGIDQPKVWASLISEKRDKDIIYPYYRGMGFIKGYLPKVAALLQQQNLEYTRHHNHISITAPSIDGQELITVIMPESENELSSPERLIKVLNSLSLFYQVFSEMVGYTDKGLSVIAIDSGSDKSFDLLGAAKVVTAVKEFILGIWDRVVFYKEKKLEQRIELIIKALPVLETIKSMEEEKKIGPEQAEIFKRNIMNGVKDFLLAGAILPEFENHAKQSPRLLMAPEPKLLNTSQDQQDAKSAFVSEIDIDQNSEDAENELTDEEKKILDKLSKKSKNRSSK